MRYLLASMAVLLLISATPATAPAASSEPAPLLPESLAARAEMAANQKTLTVLIEKEDPKELTELLNSSTEEYAKKGWTVHTITPYTNDGDVDGFFITYQKSLIIN